jgi:sugar phosphate isomerase/epimerase
MSDIERMAAGAALGFEDQAIVGVGLSTSDSAPTLSALGPCLDHFETLDLDSVEIHLPSMEVVLDARINAARLAELRRLTADRPFAITLHGAVSSDLGGLRHHKLQRDVCRASQEVAGEIGANTLVHHSTIIPYLFGPGMRWCG